MREAVQNLATSKAAIVVRSGVGRIKVECLQHRHLDIKQSNMANARLTWV